MPQAFINTARKIYEKIETGVFDVSNEVRALAKGLPAASLLSCNLSTVECTLQMLNFLAVGVEHRSPQGIACEGLIGFAADM